MNLLDEWEERKNKALEEDWAKFSSPVTRDYSYVAEGASTEAYAEPNAPIQYMEEPAPLPSRAIPSAPPTFEAQASSLPAPIQPPQGGIMDDIWGGIKGATNSALDFRLPTINPANGSIYQSPSLRDVGNAAGDTLQFLAENDPTIQTGTPGTSPGQLTLDAYSANIPYYSDFVRDTASPFIGDRMREGFQALNNVNRIADYSPTLQGGATSTGPSPAIGEFIGRSALPVTAGEVAIELSPLGIAGDIRRGIGRGATNVAAFPGRFLPGGEAIDDAGDTIDLLAESIRRLEAGETVADLNRAARPPVPRGPGVADTLDMLNQGVTRETAETLGMSPSQPLPPGRTARARAVGRAAFYESQGAVTPLPSSPIPAGGEPDWRVVQAAPNRGPSMRGAGSGGSGIPPSEPPLPPQGSFPGMEPLPGRRETLQSLAVQEGLQPPLMPERQAGPALPRDPVWVNDPPTERPPGWTPRDMERPPIPAPVQGPRPRPNLAEGYMPEGAQRPLQAVPDAPTGVTAPLPTPAPGPRAPFRIQGASDAANKNIDFLANDAIDAIARLPDTRTFSAPTTGISGSFSNPVVDEIVQRERELGEAINRFAADVLKEPTSQGAVTRNLGRPALRADTEIARLKGQFREAALTAKYGAATHYRDGAGNLVTVASKERQAAESALKSADVERVAGGITSRGLDVVNNTMRQIILNFDLLGVAGQQGLRAMRGSTAIGTGIIGRVAKAIGANPGIYRRGDIDEIAQMMADTVQMGKGGVTADITKQGLSSIPYLGDALDAVTTFQFEHILGTVRKLAYEGLLIQNKLLGQDITDPAVRRTVAEFANVIGSTSRPASTPRRAALESRGLLSARMTRAQANEIAIVPKTIRSTTDAINTANFIASTAALAGAGYYLNQSIGLDDKEMDMVDWAAKHFNPNNSEFGRITTKYKNAKGENIVIDFLPQTQILRTGIRSINDMFKGDTKGAARNMLRFGVGRSSPVVATGARIAGGTGYDSSGRFSEGGMGLADRFISSIPAPIALSSVISGETDPLSIGLAQSGVTAYGETGRPAIDRARDQQARALGFNSFKEVMDQGVRNQIDNTPEVKTLNDKRLQERMADGDPLAKAQVLNMMARQEARYGQDGAIDIDSRLAAGEITGEQARIAYDDLMSALAIESRTRYRDPEVEAVLKDIPERDLDPLEKARASYYRDVVDASEVGQDKLDFDRYADNLARWEAANPDFTKEQVAPARPLSRFHAELQQDRITLKPYREAQDAAWQEVQKSVPEMAGYDSFYDARNAAKLHYMKQDFPADVADSMASGFMREYTGFLSQQAQEFLTSTPENFELINTLDKWGYNVPAELQLYVTPVRP